MTSDESMRSKLSKPAQNFKDLIVWQKAMVLARLTYELTRAFPNEEKYGRVSQMRRAAISIPSNIAEGQARQGTGEFVQFISHAEGSLAELETQFRLSVELSFLDSSQPLAAFAMMEELRKMLNALRRRLVTRH